MAKLGPDFYKKLVEITNELGMKAEDLLVVMSIESGLDPTAHNKNGNASGLVQFMPSTLKGYGFKGTHADFRNLDAVAQLDYVKRMIKDNIRYNGGPFKSAAQYYISNFIPAALKIKGVQQENPSTIIVSKNPSEAHIPHVSIKQEMLFYNANTALDADKDGNITYGDIQRVINNATNGKNFKQAIEDMRRYTGYNPSSNFNKRENLSNKTKDNDVYSRLNSLLPSANNITDVLDNYLQMVTASDNNKKIYNKFLPINDILINVKSENIIDSIEFARVLCATLDEELLSTSEVYTDNNNVEVKCSIAGPSDTCFHVVDELSKSVSDAFVLATNKIGGIIVKTSCSMNKEPSYKQISVQASDSNYRKFLLKFI